MSEATPQVETEGRAAAMRSASPVLDALDWFLPDALIRSAREDETRRGRILVATSVASLVLASIIVPVWSHTWPLSSALVILGFAFVSAGVLYALRRGVSVARLGNAHSAYFFVGSMGLTYASGGATIAAMASLIILPMLAMVLSGSRAGIFWTGAVIAGLSVTAWSMPSADLPVEAYVSPGWMQLRFWLVGLMSAGLTGLGLTYASLNRVAKGEIEEGQRAIALSEQRYRSLAENAGDIVADLDHRLRCTFISPNCFSIVGYTPHELIGDMKTERFDPGEYERLKAIVQRSYDDLVPLQTPIRFRHAKGHSVSLEASFNTYRDRSTGKIRSVVVARDVSELRRAQAAVRHSERLASTGTLAAGMAHQVNNPVGAILNCSQYALLALEDGDLGQVKEALENNIDQARRCGNVVHSLLQFSRSQPMTKSPEDLGDLISHAIDLTATYAAERHVDVDFVAQTETRTVHVNAVEIEQVLVNLIRNAIEASSPGERIEARLSAREGDACVAIEDQGRGVAEADLPHVFDPFFTTRINEGGSGLGLSVAHGIIAEHGGRMDFDSTLGRGSVVSFSLPVFVCS